MDLIKNLWELLSSAAFFKALFGATPPAWYAVVLQPLLFFLIIIALVGFVWKNLSEPVTALIEWLRRFRASADERQRIRRRHQFAEHMLRRIARRNEEEYWDPRRFTDLEADYYAGHRAGLSLWRRIRSPFSVGPQRVKAIARALVKLPDPFVLVEGDPGSGKTILLREVADRLCVRAATSWKSAAPVALYFNLKMLDRPADRPIDSELIRQFVLDQLRRSGPAIVPFLDEYFARGIDAGWWVFLFD